MEQPIAQELTRFLWAVAVGLALGVAYDLCRGPRRLWPRLTWVLDLVFGLCLTWALVYFTLVPGDGRLRFFALAAMALGGGLWSGFLSRPFLRCYVACLRAVGTVLGAILSPLTKFLIFLRQLAKKYFSTWRKWVRILCKAHPAQDACQSPE